jgi:hypothetical protein
MKRAVQIVVPVLVFVIARSNGILLGFIPAMLTYGIVWAVTEKLWPKVTPESNDA